jgi:hypothetical protein
VWRILFGTRYVTRNRLRVFPDALQDGPRPAAVQPADAGRLLRSGR